MQKIKLKEGRNDRRKRGLKRMQKENNLKRKKGILKGKNDFKGNELKKE